MISNVMTKRTYKETDLSRYLKTARKRTNLSQNDVADLTSQMDEPFQISNGFVCQIEKGAIPSPYKLLAFTRLYNVPIIEFYRAMGATDEELGIENGNLLKPSAVKQYCEKLEQLYHLHRKSFDVIAAAINASLEPVNESSVAPEPSPRKKEVA